MDYRHYGPYVFVMPNDKRIYANEAYAWCKDHGMEVARFEELKDFENAGDFIRRVLPDKVNHSWYVDGEMFRTLPKEEGLLITKDNGKYQYANFICMYTSQNKEQDLFESEVFHEVIPEVNKKFKVIPVVNNTTHPGFPKLNGTSDVSVEEKDVIPVGNDFSMKNLFSRRDFTFFVLFISAVSLFVIVVALAIALSCVCKKYKKAKAKNITDTEETV